VILTDERWKDLLHTRATDPGAVRQAYATRLEHLLVALANPAVDGVASGRGTTSAHTWLKLPSTDSAAVLGATTLPVVVLGVLRGLVVGRTLLYPPGGDVGAAVDAAAKVLEAAK
jgi:hypothetical protein